MRRRRRGFTLIELTVALMITALIALGVASILQAASYGTSSRREVRRIVGRTQQLRTRLASAVRTSRAVLASGSGYIVLWRHDLRDNDEVNLSELMLIELPGGSDTVSAYTADFPDGWSEAQIESADTAYAAGSDFAAVAQTEKAGSYFPGTTWATGISNFTVTLDDATPTAAKLVTWSLTLTDQLLDETVAGAIGLRAQAPPQ